ncbi:AAA family ATPase [Actinoplanes sp. NPDC026670]|uniref:ATP-binding protein n=1 Tax=Actinoplanes sp. NPDC026670 TaxID=3154700 RepID=UPI0033C6AB6B
MGAFVGRRAELDLLDGAARRARDGAGGAVFLLGEAGIGKSRLAAEAAAGHSRTGGRVVKGRAGVTPLRALSEAVLTATRFDGVTLDRLGEFKPVVWRLAAGGGPADPPLVRAEAMLRLLALCGRAAGCLLILEDLHEADRDTTAVVDYLLDNVATEPVLIVGTLRPGPGPALETVTAAARRRAAVTVELRPFDRAETAALVSQCLGGEAPGELVDRVDRGAEGNPFVIEELVAALADDRGDPQSPVPASVTAAILDRVERLGAGVAPFLRGAAVFGRTFSMSGAAAAAGVSETEALRCLRLAGEARLVGPDAGDRYSFRHALTAEAMLARLLPAERARLCAAAAAAVEAGDDGQWQAAELWAAAGRPDRAAASYARSGRRAVEQGAIATAVTLLDRGLTHAVDPATTAGLLETLTTALAAAGEAARVFELGDRLDTLLSAIDAPPARRVAARLARARAAATAGAWDRGLDEIAAARAVAGEPAAPIDAVAAFLSFASTRPDRITVGRRYATAALTGAERAALPEVACEALEVLVRCARDTDLPAAAGHARRMLEVARRHDLPYWRLRAAVESATIAKELTNDIEPLLAIRQEAIDAGVVITVAWIDFHLAIAYLLRGATGDAQRHLAHATEAGNRLRQPELQLVAFAGAATLAACRPDRAALERVLEPLVTQEMFAHGAETWWYLRAVCSWMDEDPERALRELGEAEAAVEAAGHLRGAGHRTAQLLLRVGRGLAGWTEYDKLAGSPLSQQAFHRSFLTWSRAILLGRDGRTAETEEALAEAFAAGARTPLHHHLAARVAAPAALAEGWGAPLDWLRAAEEFFHDSGRTRAAAGCRALLREAGAGNRQRRAGHDTLPARLRLIGVTVREYDVLRLVAERLGNTEIAERLFLSPRTVERHIGSLRQRTGQPDRAHLIAYARKLLAD